MLMNWKKGEPVLVALWVAVAGYAISAEGVAALGLLMHGAGMHRADAVMLAVMMGFVVWALLTTWLYTRAMRVRRVVETLLMLGGLKGLNLVLLHVSSSGVAS